MTSSFGSQLEIFLYCYYFPMSVYYTITVTSTLQHTERIFKLEPCDDPDVSQARAKTHTGTADLAKKALECYHKVAQLMDHTTLLSTAHTHTRFTHAHTSTPCRGSCEHVRMFWYCCYMLAGVSKSPSNNLSLS